MAEALTNIAGALAQTFKSELTRNWNRKAVLAQQLPIVSGGGQGGGQNVAWDVQFSDSGAVGATFSEGTDIGSGEFLTDPVTKAVLNWGMYRAAFQLSNLEIDAARANVSNATALEDIVGERFLGSIAAITDAIETDLFVGTAAPAIVGLDTAITATGSSSGYAGVNSSTHTEWLSTVSANGGTPQDLTMQQLAVLEQGIYTKCGMSPDFVITTPAVHSKYESLFNPAVRTVNDGSAPIPGYQGSTTQLFWRANRVLRSRRCTAGELFMLNSDEIELVVLPFTNVPDGVMVVTRNAMSSNGKEMDTIGIPFKVYPLGRTGSAIKFVVEVYIQLRVKRPNAHGLLKDIKET